jgi:hypothetical protein
MAVVSSLAGEEVHKSSDGGVLGQIETAFEGAAKYVFRVFEDYVVDGDLCDRICF